MAKIIRLTESDLNRIVRRVINEQYDHTIQNTNGIPCIKKEFVYGTYKINYPKLMGKLQGKLSSSPILSEKNVFLYNKTNISLPQKKYGDIRFYSENTNVLTMNLDGTKFGEELYALSEKVLVDQGGDIYKIGWVFCNGVLYIYDIFGEKESNNGRI